uniref:Uncharacterized protein n=1 Tax=Ananas comosus var. bracteatus TaxID=296719 RepID=A0A6V7PRU2_ANACO|nr:unnamed protein product [Ananas comosus var. bracteatus]
MAGFWAKLPLIRALLLAHPEVEFLWWMDSDAMFTDMAFELPCFLLRNCQWSLDLLDAWAPMGPKGPVRAAAGKLLTSALKDRPVFEADDQSAMVYLLATQRDKWGPRSTWRAATTSTGTGHPRRPLRGDDREPPARPRRPPLAPRHPLRRLQALRQVRRLPVERCLKQMDRAFNFGDNQILQMYGFAHKSLSSRRVKRIRNDTAAPLDAQDDLGLLHPSFKAVDVAADSQSQP